MRFVQVAVPAGKQADVTSALNEDDIDYAITEASGDDGYDAIVSFPLTEDAIEPTLNRLRKVGLTDDAWTVVLDTQTVVSEGLNQLRADDDDQHAPKGRIAREELRMEATDLAPERSESWSYVVMTAISAVVAVVGLLQIRRP